MEILERVDRRKAVRGIVEGLELTVNVLPAGALRTRCGRYAGFLAGDVRDRIPTAVRENRIRRHHENRIPSGQGVETAAHRGWLDRQRSGTKALVVSSASFQGSIDEEAERRRGRGHVSARPRLGSDRWAVPPRRDGS